MADQSVMSTPIFDELLREMTESAAAEAKAEEAGTPTPPAQPSQGGRRRARAN
ncbi:hypothetical protein V5P93_004970 [Actinokineospora auranticolor]|uniref:Uncharacterized protein n=1 Tax=Actinokineospora auranticolor TaxID=155976 RepID=A0A2S6GBD8_9PSEU|nr:hypothetical protein [Actinokineospora auranticolor]PPK61218.1 hypothetical protein CLV40_14314 [Actinokineospora auranticolor]